MEGNGSLAGRFLGESVPEVGAPSPDTSPSVGSTIGPDPGAVKAGWLATSTSGPPTRTASASAWKNEARSATCSATRLA